MKQVKTTHPPNLPLYMGFSDMPISLTISKFSGLCIRHRDCQGSTRSKNWVTNLLTDANGTTRRHISNGSGRSEGRKRAQIAICSRLGPFVLRTVCHFPDCVTADAARHQSWKIPMEPASCRVDPCGNCPCRCRQTQVLRNLPKGFLTVRCELD